jgi:hypothetical protein
MYQNATLRFYVFFLDTGIAFCFTVPERGILPYVQMKKCFFKDTKRVIQI